MGLCDILGVGGREMRVVSLGRNTLVPAGATGTVVKADHTQYLVDWDTFRKAGHSVFWIDKKNVKEEDKCWWIDKDDTVPEVKRGDRVLVWDEVNTPKQERIYITTIEGIRYPHIVVMENHEDNFKKGEDVWTQNYKHMEPLLKKKEMTLAEIELELGYEKGTLGIKK